MNFLTEKNLDEMASRFTKSFLAGRREFLNEDIDMLYALMHSFLEYFTLSVCQVDKGDKCKIIWLNIKDMAEEPLYEFVRNTFSDYLLSNDSFSCFAEKLMDEFDDKILLMENELLERKIEPFYGDENFLKHRIVYTISKILDVIASDKIDGDIKNKFNGFYDILKDYLEELPNLKMVGDYEYQKKVYEVLESYYKTLLDIESFLAPYIEKIWNKKINENELCGLAHGFSKEEFLPNEATKVCTTYFDENYITIFGEYGYLYPMDIKKCDIICSEDAGSFYVSKTLFVEDIKKWYNKFTLRDLVFDSALTYNGKCENLTYSRPNYSILSLPDTVLKENYISALKNNMVCKANMPFGFGYNEIVFIDENKELNPTCVWVKKDIDNCNWKEIYDKAEALSLKLNLPLMVIDVQKIKKDYQKNIKTKTLVDNMHKI